MGTLYLARHGETDSNALRRVQGLSDIPLNENGRLQAGRLAGRLAHTPFAAAYASDSSRATETAEIVVRGRSISLHRTAELREISYGQWEGLTFEEVENRDPVGFARYNSDGLSDDLEFAPPGGETVRALLARIDAFLESLRGHHDGEDLLLVAHGISLRAVLVCLLRLPPEAMPRFSLGNASLSAISLHPEGAVLEFWNDTSHLG
jgi:broad specificity phosphatase PhoE